ncbi:gp172 [Sphingomonas phage PAU]|uniref:thymidylate kinase n=1 Tax=Sphingomonas phage PAU TaxID=1150991 RepID=UPI00025732F8|nr:thymidylate kinase [Sphingomonas phage PAU]AFF28170.1 gp172 [Sphingomonas phage PAU]
MKLVIVEGIDRIGKTTFISNLKTKLEETNSDVIIDNRVPVWCPRIALNHPPYCYEYYNAFAWSQFLEMLKLFNHKDSIIIMDRHHGSSEAYGIIKRKSIIEELYESVDIFKERIQEFEIEMMKLLGESNVHYVQFIADKIGIKDDITKLEDLKSVNKYYEETFDNRKIKNKYLIKLESDENFETNIMTHLDWLSKLINETK